MCGYFEREKKAEEEYIKKLKREGKYEPIRKGYFRDRTGRLRKIPTSAYKKRR